MIRLQAIDRRLRTQTVAVVDPRPADYATLPKAVGRPGMTWRFPATAREALRLARREDVDLWVINLMLPDMSGIDLCGMLRNHAPPPAVFVVTDAYRAEDERAARIHALLVRLQAGPGELVQLLHFVTPCTKGTKR